MAFMLILIYITICVANETETESQEKLAIEYNNEYENYNHSADKLIIIKPLVEWSLESLFWKFMDTNLGKTLLVLSIILAFILWFVLVICLLVCCSSFIKIVMATCCPCCDYFSLKARFDDLKYAGRYQDSDGHVFKYEPSDDEVALIQNIDNRFSNLF